MARVPPDVPLAMGALVGTWALVAVPILVYVGVSAAWPRASEDQLVLLGTCCAIAPALLFGGWVLSSVPSPDAVAQREVYGAFAGWAVDVATLGAERQALRQRVLEQVMARAQAVLPTGYRETIAPAGSWAVVALDPRADDAPLTAAALTLARLDWSLSRRGRGELRALHRALWQKLRRIDPALRPS